MQSYIKVKWNNNYSFFLWGESEEPSALSWMSIVYVFFRDLDGHPIEYLDMLNEERKPSLGIIT